MESLGGLKRTHYCGDLRESNIGEEVVLMGWVQKKRNLGGLVFADLRDIRGICQIVFDTDVSKYQHSPGIQCITGTDIAQHQCCCKVAAARFSGDGINRSPDYLKLWPHDGVGQHLARTQFQNHRPTLGVGKAGDDPGKAIFPQNRRGQLPGETVSDRVGRQRRLPVDVDTGYREEPRSPMGSKRLGKEPPRANYRRSYRSEKSRPN